MNRPQHYRDNTSDRGHGGKDLHTYTPRSHEDLIRSHLKLDAQRQTTQQNEYKRLANESDALKRELDRAREDINRKNNEIAALNDKLKNTNFEPTSKYPKPILDESYRQVPPYEIDGKPATLDEVTNHFSTIIERHHDLLSRKSQQIKNLQNKLNQAIQKGLEYKEDSVREYQRQSGALQEELRNELDQIRKEYDKSNYILTERKNKLERVLEDLERKKIEYSNEIINLKNDLTHGQALPSDSNMKLILDEKKRENVFLKDKLEELENKNLRENTLKKEIMKVIESKHGVVKKLHEVISKIEKQPSSEIMPPKPDPKLQRLEEDCLKAMSEVNEAHNRLNDIVRKLKDHSCSGEVDLRDKNDITPDLENVKIQCQLEIDALKTLLVRQPDDNSLADSYVSTYPVHDKYEPPSNYLKDYQRSEVPRIVQSPRLSSRWAQPGPSKVDCFKNNECEACSDVHLAPAQPQPVKRERLVEKVLSPQSVGRFSRQSSSFSPEAQPYPRRKLIGDQYYYYH